MLEFILTKNNFEFNGAHYVQKHGTTMGTRCAPTYANIFIDCLEKQAMNGSALKPEIFFRFIDDTLKTFMEKIL